MNRKYIPAVCTAVCALLFGACASALKCSDTKDGITVEMKSASFTNKGIKTVTPDLSIINSSEEDITGVSYEVTFYDAEEAELETIRMFWRCDEEPLKAGSSVHDTDSRYTHNNADQAKSAKLVITDIKTAKDYPPDRVPKKGEYLYQATGDEKLAAIQEQKPVKIVAGIDQSGYVRTATFEDELLEEAIDAFVKIRLGDDDAPMVTDNYNYVVFYWEDGTTSGINLNLKYLELQANGRYHSYYLENLGEFWSLVNEHLVDPESTEEDQPVSDEMNHVRAVLADVVYRESGGKLLPEPYVKFTNESSTEYLGAVYEISYYDENRNLLGRQQVFTKDEAGYTPKEEWEEHPKENRPEMSEMPSAVEIHILDTISRSTLPSIRVKDGDFLYQAIENDQIRSIQDKLPVLMEISSVTDSDKFNGCFFEKDAKDAVQAFAQMKIQADAEDTGETGYQRILILFEDGEEIHLNLINGHLIAMEDDEFVEVGVSDEGKFFELAKESGS